MPKLDTRSITFLHFTYFLVCILCLTPLISSAAALLLGMVFALVLGNPFSDWTRKATSRLLQVSIVGLGAGMNLSVVGQVGAQGISYTAVGIILTLVMGLILGKLLRVEEDTSLLLTVGTAICGGSAIAAVASTIRAKSHDISIALATVFFLNASALLIFPQIGHFFNLDENQFGLWSALAIHDTSSVVGSAIQYGAKAVEVATTVKLARALWIIPVSIGIGMMWNKKKMEQNAKSNIARPWFILGFLIAAALVTWIPALQPAGQIVNKLAKQILILTLFFIGSNLSRATIKSVGVQPLIQGLCLWIIVSASTLGAILINWIH